MAEELGSIWAEVRLNYSQYDEGVAHVVRQNKWLDEEMQRTVQRLASRWEGLGGRMSVAATAPLTMLGRQWLNTFADFQQAMANTQSVMGATVEELEALTAAARKAGEETVFKASQAADALYNLGQAGMDASQAIDALDGVLTLAVASQSELAFTAEVVVSTLNQFGLAANEASRVANVFAAANAESLAELDMLAASLKNAGPVAATFGYSLEETVAALMALYNAGFQGEQAGNMLKRAISDLANPVGDAVNVLSELGLTVRDVHPELNSLADIIDTLNAAGIDSTQSLRLFGQVAGPGMITLLNQGGEALRQYTESITGTNKAAEQASIQLDTLQGDIKIMQSVYESMVLEMTGNFEPALRQITQRITELFGWIRDLNPETQKLIVTIAGFAAAAGPTMLIISQLLKALPLLFGPAGWIYGGIAAVTALAFAMTGSSRDMREFYQESIEASRAAEQQAMELRALANEYRELEGKPSKSEEEHRRLKEVMERIVELQPELAVGYETIDEAIRANIGTLETYIEKLETQSELHLRLASLEYLRTRNQLEQELNQLLGERSQKESQVQKYVSEAERLVRLANEAQMAFMDWLEAQELGLEDAAKRAEETMRRVLVEWKPDHVAQDSPFGLWGKWVSELTAEAERISGQSGALLEDLDKINARIAEIQDTQAHAAAVMAELERRQAGIPLTGAAPTTAPPAGTGGGGPGTGSEKTIEELEAEVRAEMDLYRARIELVRSLPEEYEATYGTLESLHERYIDFLKQRAVDTALSEVFRGNVIATELQNVRDELDKMLRPEKGEDPDTLVAKRMQVYEAELELLRLGVQRYKDELGGLEGHLQKYRGWLQEQTVDTALSAATQVRIQEAISAVEDELDRLALTTEERWARVFDIVARYGPQADAIRKALDLGEVQVDLDDLEKAEKHIENYYRHLVEAGQVTLHQHLEVLNYQLDKAAVGTDEWLQIWREIASVQEKIKREEERTEDNEALRERLQLFEQLKHFNDATVDSYEKQIEWLQTEVLAAEGVIRTTEERMAIENEIFALRMANYRLAVEREGWSLQQQLENLERYVGAYAKSFDQIQEVERMRRQLLDQRDESELRRVNEALRERLQLFEQLKHLNDATVDSYEKQIEWLQTEVLAAEGVIRTTEERMAIENEIFALRMANYRLAVEREGWSLQQQLENLERYVGAYAKSFDQIQEVERMRRQLLDQRDESELRRVQELNYKKQEVEIQRLRNEGRLEEADIAESLLRLNRELDQYKDNLAMQELAYQAHQQRLTEISARYAEQRARKLGQEIADQIRAMGDLREADLSSLKAWIDERKALYAGMEGGGGRYALAELEALELRIQSEEERRFEEWQRREQQWQSFLIQSRQIGAAAVLEEQVRTLEAELAVVDAGNERRLELERELQQAKYNLAKQNLEDQRALLNAMVIEEELSAEDRLDIVRRMREEYEQLYGDLYRFSQEWQELRRQEKELEGQIAQETAKNRIESIQYNKSDLASLQAKYNQLVKLIQQTDNYIEQQEYLNELLKTRQEIKDAEDATARFFAEMSPEWSEITQQIEDFLRLIQEAPQAFENMRFSMRQAFGEFGDAVAGIYGTLAGYLGAGGTFEKGGSSLAAIIAGITGGFAGLTGDPVLAAISTGVSFIARIFDPGPIPQEMQSLKKGIEDLNRALEEYGVTYRSVEADIRKTYFLIWHTGWEFVNEEEAKAGYEIGKVMIESMNETLRTLGSAMAAAVAGKSTWDEFEQTLGQQLRRILMEQIMQAAEFEKNAKLVVGLMQESVADGFTDEEIERIRKAWRDAFDELQRQWDEYSDILDQLLPEEDRTVQHEVRGVQITRLSGQDRDLFVELLRPLANLDRLPGLLDSQAMDVYQTFQMAEITALHAQEVLIQQVLINQVNVNLSGVTDVRSFLEELVREALSTADGGGLTY